MHTFYTGKQDYQRVDFDEANRTLTTTFTEQPIFACTSLKESLENDIRSLGNKKIAVLFSGGMDSEIVLEVCKDVGADFYPIFCLYTYKNMPVNTHELYHAEAYCRANKLSLKIIKLDLEWFFESSEYLGYVKKYLCDIAQICPYLWMIDQIDDCLILGGDAPHITNHNPIQFFAPLLGQVSVERKFAIDGRPGIPNFLTYSLTSMCYCLKLWQKQAPKIDLSVTKRVLKIDDARLIVPDSPNFVKRVFPRWAYTTMKHGMYTDGGFNIEIKPKYSSPFALLADLPKKEIDAAARIFHSVSSTIIPCPSMCVS